MFRKVSLISLAGILWVAFVAGCGGATDSDTEGAGRVQPGFAIDSVGACLHSGGAMLAGSANDLGFLFAAEAKGEVSKVLLAYDKNSDSLVRMWTAPVVETHPPSWVVWFGQGLSTDLSPGEIVDSQPSGAYVFYVNHPSAVIRKKTGRCIKFATKNRSTSPTNFHSVK